MCALPKFEGLPGLDSRIGHERLDGRVQFSPRTSQILQLQRQQVLVQFKLIDVSPMQIGDKVHGRSPVGGQVDVGLSAADTADQANALQCLGQFFHRRGLDFGQ